MKHSDLVQLVLLSALWGASFMFLRIAAPALGIWVLPALRVLLATCVLVMLMLALRHAWPWSHWRELMGLSALTMVVPFVLYAYGALHLPAGYSALLNTTAVLFGAIVVALLGDERLTLWRLAGCVCGFAGVGLIVQLGPVQPTPQVLWAAAACVGAAACYGLATPFIKRATQRMQPLQIAAGIHLAGCAMLWPGAAWGWPQAQFTPVALGAVAMLGFVTSGLGFWLHMRIISRISPVAAMSPSFLIPFFGVAWGHIFLGEPLGSGLLGGGLLVLLAVALVSNFNPLRRRPPPPQPSEIDATP